MCLLLDPSYLFSRTRAKRMERVVVFAFSGFKVPGILVGW